MIYYPQFKSLCEKVVDEMGATRPGSTLAVSMIVAHESKGGTYLKQVGSGIALGVIQMEKPTHSDTWLHSDHIKRLSNKMGIRENFAALEYDLRYNIFMARVRLMMDTKPLPTDPHDMAVYLKSYWNSDSGKATPEKYLNDFHSWVGV